MKKETVFDPVAPMTKPEGFSFRRAKVITAISVGTINVSKTDQCSCTGQPGQCE